MKPKISIIIPTKNEENYINKTISVLLEQDYPKNKLEILFLDAMSTDRTREIINEYSKRYEFIKIFDNPDIFVPFAFNKGIKNAKGDIIITMGAHTNYSPNYVATIDKYLSENKAECVGSVAHTLPGSNTTIAKAIAMCLSLPFGVGNSHMRIGFKEDQYVDTASCPGYKKEIFDKIGLFNENLLHSQDMEFNIRLRNSGGRILAVSSIISYYYARSDYLSFCKHNFRNGLWSILPFKYTKKLSVKLRHLVPLIFILSLLCTLGLWILFGDIGILAFALIFGLYALLSLSYSARIAIKENYPQYVIVMPVLFATLHIVYGVGSFLGLIKCIFSKKFWGNQIWTRIMP